MILHCATFHLTKIVQVLVLLIDASFRFLFVFLFRTSFLSRISFLLKSWISSFVKRSSLVAFLLMLLVLSLMILFRFLSRFQISISMRKNSFFVSMIVLLFQLLLITLLANIAISMKRNSFAFLLLLMRLLMLLLHVSMHSFWSLIWLRKKKVYLNETDIIIDLNLYWIFDHNETQKIIKDENQAIIRVETYRIKKSINCCWDIHRIRIQNHSDFWHLTMTRIFEIIAE